MTFIKRGEPCKSVNTKREMASPVRLTYKLLMLVLVLLMPTTHAMPWPPDQQLALARRRPIYQAKPSNRGTTHAADFAVYRFTRTLALLPRNCRHRQSQSSGSGSLASSLWLLPLRK